MRYLTNISLCGQALLRNKISKEVFWDTTNAQQLVRALAACSVDKLRKVYEASDYDCNERQIEAVDFLLEGRRSKAPNVAAQYGCRFFSKPLREGKFTPNNSSNNQFKNAIRSHALCACFVMLWNVSGHDTQSRDMLFPVSGPTLACI
jgi:hypothetical protein